MLLDQMSKFYDASVEAMSQENSGTIYDPIIVTLHLATDK